MASIGIQVFFPRKVWTIRQAFPLSTSTGKRSATMLPEKLHCANCHCFIVKLDESQETEPWRKRGGLDVGDGKSWGSTVIQSFGKHFWETKTCLLFLCLSNSEQLFLGQARGNKNCCFMLEKTWVLWFSKRVSADLRNSLHARIVGKLASESVYVLPAVRGWAPWVAAGPPRRAVEWSIGDQRLHCWYPTSNQVRIFCAKKVSLDEDFWVGFCSSQGTISYLW